MLRASLRSSSSSSSCLTPVSPAGELEVGQGGPLVVVGDGDARDDHGAAVGLHRGHGHREGACKVELCVGGCDPGAPGGRQPHLWSPRRAA